MVKDLKSLKWQFITLFLFLITFVLIGYHMKISVDSLDPLISDVNPMSVFNNNVKVSLVMMAGGLVTFGIFTIINLVINGITIGNALYIDGLHNGAFHAFISVFPHGIFEVPAIIISSVAGIQITIIIVDALRKTTKSPKTYVKRIVALTLFSTILLFIGSIVESYITPIFI